MITLLGAPTPNTRKIGIALNEMKLEWRLQIIDMLAGEQLTPEFLKLNPNNKTPVIIDDDGPCDNFVLWDSGAILLYLAEKSGLFLPKDPVKRALCWQWLMFQMSGVGPMFGQAAHFAFYAAERHEYPTQRFNRETARLMRVLDGRLAEAEWLAGDEYTIADMATMPWLQQLLADQGEQYPNAARWNAAMLDREEVREGLKTGTARPETIEGGGLTGLSEEQQSILWGDRQHQTN